MRARSCTRPAAAPAGPAAAAWGWTAAQGQALLLLLPLRARSHTPPHQLALSAAASRLPQPCSRLTVGAQACRGGAALGAVPCACRGGRLCCRTCMCRGSRAKSASGGAGLQAAVPVPGIPAEGPREAAAAVMGVTGVGQSPMRGLCRMCRMGQAPMPVGTRGRSAAAQTARALQHCAMQRRRAMGSRGAGRGGGGGAGTGPGAGPLLALQQRRPLQLLQLLLPSRGLQGRVGVGAGMDGALAARARRQGRRMCRVAGEAPSAHARAPPLPAGPVWGTVASRLQQCLSSPSSHTSQPTAWAAAGQAAQAPTVLPPTPPPCSSRHLPACSRLSRPTAHSRPPAATHSPKHTHSRSRTRALRRRWVPASPAWACPAWACPAWACPAWGARPGAPWEAPMTWRTACHWGSASWVAACRRTGRRLRAPSIRPWSRCPLCPHIPHTPCRRRSPALEQRRCTPCPVPPLRPLVLTRAPWVVLGVRHKRTRPPRRLSPLRLAAERELQRCRAWAWARLPWRHTGTPAACPPRHRQQAQGAMGAGAWLKQGGHL